MLKAIGKFIDTMPIQKLLSQEEARTDVVTIEVDRFYGTHDLSEFQFLMRGITESGGEAAAYLPTETDEMTIRLFWEVGPKFTKEAGTLALDLIAYRFEEEADPTVDAPDYLLRYQLPSVEVRALPDGSHTLDEQSYTAFLAMVRETAAQCMKELTDVSSEIWKEVNRLSGVAEFHKQLLAACEERINDHEERIQNIKDAFVPIVILSEKEYQNLSEKDPKTLYVVRENSDTAEL